MQVGWGIVVVVLSLVCWAGQTVSWVAPTTAESLNLMEAEDDVDPVYWADIRGEALWDFFTLWTMVVTGILLITDSAGWPYFGLVGGGIYVYFAGRGIVTRVVMVRYGHRIGAPQNVKLGFVLLGVWGVMAAATIVLSAVALA